MSEEEFLKYTNELAADYDISIYNAETYAERIDGQTSNLNCIYRFVLILMAIILAITINAAFVGMYQNRTFEFSVYRGIGYSKKRIVCKIMSELLWLDGIGLAAGGILFFSGLYLFNNLCLYPVGKYLRYFHSIALFGLILCNIIVLIPLFITRCRQLVKADICEY